MSAEKEKKRVHFPLAPAPPVAPSVHKTSGSCPTCSRPFLDDVLSLIEYEKVFSDEEKSFATMLVKRDVAFRDRIWDRYQHRADWQTEIVEEHKRARAQLRESTTKLVDLLLAQVNRLTPKEQLLGIKRTAPSPPTTEVKESKS